MLFATSELGEALHAADRVLVMHRGRVVRELDPRTATQGGAHGGIGRRAEHRRRPATSTADREHRTTADTASDLRRPAMAVAAAGDVLLELRAFIALASSSSIFALLSDTYLTGSNLITMTRHVAINAILALGMLLVILTGGIDLSVGSIVGLSGIVAGVLLEGWQIASLDVILYPQVWAVDPHRPWPSATVVGALNGVLVTRFNVAPFIATLGMLYVARGTALLISNGATFPRLGGAPELGNTGFGFLGTGRLIGIPISIWIMVLFAVVIWRAHAQDAVRALALRHRRQRSAPPQLSGVPVTQGHACAST